MGLGANGEDQWRYVLPRGIFRTPVEKLVSANLLGDERQWLIAGADGSIHFVSEDGTPIDHFHYGDALTGLAGVRYGAEPAAARFDGQGAVRLAHRAKIGQEATTLFYLAGTCQICYSSPAFEVRKPFGDFSGNL